MDHLLRPRRNARRAPAAVPAVGSPSSKSHFGRAFRSRRWRSRSPPGSMPTASHRNAWIGGARPSDVPPVLPGGRSSRRATWRRVRWRSRRPRSRGRRIRALWASVSTTRANGRWPRPAEPG